MPLAKESEFHKCRPRQIIFTTTQLFEVMTGVLEKEAVGPTEVVEGVVEAIL